MAQMNRNSRLALPLALTVLAAVLAGTATLLAHDPDPFIRRPDADPGPGFIRSSRPRTSRAHSVAAPSPHPPSPPSSGARFTVQLPQPCSPDGVSAATVPRTRSTFP